MNQNSDSSKEIPTPKYLILDRDVDLAPTDLVPEGRLIDRLYGLFNGDAPGTLEFNTNQISALIHLAPEMPVQPQLIVTDGLKMIPGVKLLMDAFPSIPPDTAENQMKDMVHEQMQAAQGPAQEFERLMRESKLAMAPKAEKPTVVGNDDPDETV